MGKPVRVVHYLNQFFGGIGGEERAQTPLEVREGSVGPGRLLQQALGAEGTVVATLVCGDDYVAEREDAAGASMREALQRYQPDLVMAGPAFDPDACLALPTASIAVMGPQAAINAVFYNQLQAIEDDDERARRTEELRAEYSEEIDILHLASELVIDAVVQPADLRRELVKRFAAYASRDRSWPAKHNAITPV